MNESEYYTLSGRSVDRLKNALMKIIESPVAGGVILLMCAVVSLLWANSPLAVYYTALLTTKLTIGIGTSITSQSILFWINDGLMVIFFFVVGLELKHELVKGELSSVQKAALPIVAAAGGMIIPAVLFVALNLQGTALRGWGIPMATDIAFAVGILVLLGRRVPPQLRIFLLALAVVDDLGAILVIAFFYTGELFMGWILAGLSIVILLMVLNRLGVYHLGIYSFFGVLVWICFLNSGVHPTIAGVLVALTVPSRPAITIRRFFRDTHRLIAHNHVLSEDHPAGMNRMRRVFDQLNVGTALAESPIRRASRVLSPWVNFLIMPLFALFNAGVVIPASGLVAHYVRPVTLGIMLGLFLGKQIGIFSFSWLATKMRIASLPSAVSWKQFYGIGILGGIGFTMSLFVASLAYTESYGFLNEAKIGILSGSLLSAIVGLIYLQRVLPLTAREAHAVHPPVPAESDGAFFPDTLSGE